MAWAMVDGVLSKLEDASLPVTDLGFLAGWTVFETLRVVDGRVPLLEEHLARLEGSARAATLEVPAQVESEVLALAGRMQGEARVRVTLTGSGRRVLTIEPVPSTRRGAPVRCATGPFVLDPFLDGSVKHGSRAGWMVAVRRAGVDDVLLVDDAGRFTEGTTSGVLAVRGRTVFTAPHDGRILPSTTVNDVLRVAASLPGVTLVREGPPVAGPWDALYIASATRGLAPVVELDGRALPGAEDVGRAIAAGLG